MEVMLLEIDSRGKKMLLPKLHASGMLGMKVLSLDKNNKSPETKGFGLRQRLEVYAEKSSISKLTKTIIKMARDGLLCDCSVRLIKVSTVT